MNRAVALIAIAILLTLLAPIALFTNVEAQIAQVQTYFIDAVQGMWYAVNTNGQSYRVFYYDASGNTVYVTAYLWDANPNYIIFQAPCSCRIFLRQESYSLATLDTKSWFANTLTFTVSVNIPSPWNVVKTATIPYSLSRTMTYNGTHVVVNDVYSFNTNSYIYIEHKYTSASVSAGATYTITVSVSPTIAIRLGSPSLYIWYFPSNYGSSVSGVLRSISGNTVYYYPLASVSISGTNIVFTLSSTQQTLTTSMPDSTYGAIGIYVYPNQATYTNVYTYAKDSSGIITARNGYRIQVYDSISLLPTRDVIQKSSTFVYYLYTQDISIQFKQILTQSVNTIIVPLNTTTISQTLKNPVPAVFLSDVSIWSPAWIVNYGSQESFVVFIPPLLPSNALLRASLVYNYPVRYTAPQLEYTYAVLEDTLSLFSVNGTVSRTFNQPWAVLYEGTIYLGNYLGSTMNPIYGIESFLSLSLASIFSPL